MPGLQSLLCRIWQGLQTYDFLFQFSVGIINFGCLCSRVRFPVFGQGVSNLQCSYKFFSKMIDFGFLSSTARFPGLGRGSQPFHFLIEFLTKIINSGRPGLQAQNLQTYKLPQAFTRTVPIQTGQNILFPCSGYAGAAL